MTPEEIHYGVKILRLRSITLKTKEISASEPPINSKGVSRHFL